MRPIPQPSSLDVAGVLHQAGIYALTPKEAANLLRVSEAAIYRAVRSRAGLKAHRWGGAMRILVKDVFETGEDYQRLVDLRRRPLRRAAG
jgi:excisionase family DNA binding protein